MNIRWDHILPHLKTPRSAGLVERDLNSSYALDFKHYHRSLSGVRCNQFEALQAVYQKAGGLMSYYQFAKTTRYGRAQVCVQARRSIARGEIIVDLIGVTARIPKPAVDVLEDDNLDFSLLQESRRQVSLLLGPLRFVNHECQPNCRTIYAGPQMIVAKAIRHITQGEEITLYYGPGYFGLQNHECQCRFCIVDHV